MPRPVSDSIADGLPLWDTYEALFFLLTGISIGIVLGFLFPSLWRSFRRRFRKLEKYRPGVTRSRPLGRSPKVQYLLSDSLGGEGDESQADADVVTLFVSARYAFEENSLREAVALYLQILGSEKVTRVQTNKAMFELSQVYAQSGLTAKAMETGLELLHRKPSNIDIFRFLLQLASERGEENRLETTLQLYSGPASGDLAREVAHVLSESSSRLLRDAQLESQKQAVRLAKLAVRWSPAAVEPKLALVEATSVLWRAADGPSADQLLMGFCVDLLELARLKNSSAVLSSISFEPFLRAWCLKLDSQDSEIEAAVQKMRGEILSQLRVEHQLGQSATSCEYHFVWRLLERLRISSSHSALFDGVLLGQPKWERELRKLLQVSEATFMMQELHECAECSEIHRQFVWRCRSCKRWETLSPWSSEAN